MWDKTKHKERPNRTKFRTCFCLTADVSKLCHWNSSLLSCKFCSKTSRVDVYTQLQYGNTAQTPSVVSRIQTVTDIKNRAFRFPLNITNVPTRRKLYLQLASSRSKSSSISSSSRKFWRSKYFRSTGPLGSYAVSLDIQLQWWDLCSSGILQSVNGKSEPTFRDNLSVSSSRVKQYK